MVQQASTHRSDDRSSIPDLPTRWKNRLLRVVLWPPQPIMACGHPLPHPPHLRTNKENVMRLHPVLLNAVAEIEAGLCFSLPARQQQLQWEGTGKGTPSLSAGYQAQERASKIPSSPPVSGICSHPLSTLTLPSNAGYLWVHRGNKPFWKQRLKC